MTAVAIAARTARATIVRFGSPVAVVRRGTTTRAADGSDATSWVGVPATPAVKVLLQPLTTVAAQKLWGVQTEARFRGYVADTADLQLRDGLTVSSGNYAGQRFVVVERLAEPLAGVLVLGLMMTTEAFS